MTLFDFTPDSAISDWVTVNDTVMGGVSNGKLHLDEAGNGVYSGFVSLDNNGGFSSLRYRMPTLRIVGFQKIILRLKGDGKRYQLRTKTSDYDRHSYVGYFATSGDWEEIELNLTDLEPRFRGRELNMPNYPAELLSEIAILIGNKREEEFTLLLDWIKLS